MDKGTVRVSNGPCTPASRGRGAWLQLAPGPLVATAGQGEDSSEGAAAPARPAPPAAPLPRSARTRYLVKGRLPKPVFPEQQGPGRGGGQQRGVLVLLLHLLPAPLPGAQVEQQ